MDTVTTPPKLSRGNYLIYVLIAQSAYYFVTGIWALLHMSSFLLITGEKTDLWLVRTVATLITVISAAMILPAIQKRISAESVVLAIGCIMGLTAIDVIYVTNGTISPIYLVDAVIEMSILGLWFTGWRRQR